MMPKPGPSTSDSETDESSASSGSEPELSPVPNKKATSVSPYEKQRLSRIAENKKRMEALGLRQMASSLKASSCKATTKRGDKGKRKVAEDKADMNDDDYAPALDDDEEGDDDDEEDEDFVGSGKRKGTRRGLNLKPRMKPRLKNSSDNSGSIDDDDALMKAIALSLDDSVELSGKVSGGPSEKGTGVCVRGRTEKNKEDQKMTKRKKMFTSWVKMTEDELVMHFFQFDEEGKGGISLRDLTRVAFAHDFTWTDRELANMIHCFDSNGDGKLSLDDFSKIARRCNMIQGSETL